MKGKMQGSLSLIKNYFYAMLGVALQIGGIQLIILPVMSRSLPEDEYGLILTLVAVVDMFSITLGSSLCNARLIKIDVYNELKEEGDFAALSIIFSVFSSLCSCGVSWLYCRKGLSIMLWTALFSITAFYFSYFQVYIRLRREFYNDILTSIIVLFGYGVGFLLYKAFHIWQLVYIAGYLLGGIYCGVIYGKCYLEPLNITRLFGRTQKAVIDLSGASFIRQIVSYSDRLLMLPLLGGSTVATYYAATLAGKCLSLATNPLNGIVLSFLTGKKENHFKTFRKVVLFCFFSSGFFYTLFYYISKPVIKILYPQLYSGAVQILYLTTLYAVLEGISAMLTPLAMKLFNTSLQVVISLVSTVLYIVLVLCIVPFMGIKGYCLSVVVSSSSKIICFIAAWLLSGFNGKRSLEYEDSED